VLDWLVEIASPATREGILESTGHLRDSEDEAWKLPLVCCGRQQLFIDSNQFHGSEPRRRVVGELNQP
jgi:hypothetical protein